MQGNEIGRDQLAEWQKAIKKNCFENDPDFKKSVEQYLANKYPNISRELASFADKVINRLDPLVTENNLPQNLPRIEHFDAIGNRIEKIIHHPNYEEAGNIIYGSRILERMAKPGGLLEALVFMFISSQAGEAGHNCPVACSAGIIRVLQKVDEFPQKKFYLKKLLEPSYTENYTGAQFLTEVQGGSDVGKNAMEAYQDEKGRWLVKGEKWFCSNANAELMLVTARFDPTIAGTKGLGLFLVPHRLDSGERNAYVFRRLKSKIGTQSMATAEIDFLGADAIPLGAPSQGFKMVMENVLHLSRLFNTFCVLGMARRAYQIAYIYAKHREAFGQPIINYPLVQENLARIRAENAAMLAFIFATTQLQDDFDIGKIQGEEKKLLLRLLVNLNKYVSAKLSVEHIHHALDVLAGNGTIESFSTIPRLLRDCIVCENWEGTHHTLYMQILKDIERYRVDELLFSYLDGFLVENSKILHSIDKLKKETEKLKSSNKELQSLQIKRIVDQMAILLSAIHLMGESKDSASKTHCLDYFLLLHFSDGKLERDKEYLNLIQNLSC